MVLSLKDYKTCLCLYAFRICESFEFGVDSLVYNITKSIKIISTNKLLVIHLVYLSGHYFFCDQDAVKSLLREKHIR